MYTVELGKYNPPRNIAFFIFYQSQLYNVGEVSKIICFVKLEGMIRGFEISGLVATPNLYLYNIRMFLKYYTYKGCDFSVIRIWIEYLNIGVDLELHPHGIATIF